MEDPGNPRPPPPLKYINSPLLSLLPRYAWEVIVRFHPSETHVAEGSDVNYSMEDQGHKMH